MRTHRKWHEVYKGGSHVDIPGEEHFGKRGGDFQERGYVHWMKEMRQHGQRVLSK